MLLKVGELAKRSGLTVRTLHHYDSIGLLKPSARSEAGYRLYNRDDIARLHRIQALQRFGLALAEIGTALTGPDSQLPELITRQLSLLTQQIEQADRLRTQLQRLQQQLLHGDEPDLAEWLNTLELMNMYDKYFSAEELKRIPLLGNDSARTAEWAERVQAMRTMMTNGVPTDSAEAQAAVKQWFAALERDIEGDPRLVAKLTEMHMKEPTVQAQTGITPEVIHYIQQASTHAKLAIYAKYLSPVELAHVRANYGKRIGEWPALIAAVRQEMDNGTPSDAPAVRKLALHWLDIFRSYAGDNPDTQLKIRNAHAQEPELMVGSLIDEPMLVYMRAAFAQLAVSANKQ